MTLGRCAGTAGFLAVAGLMAALPAAPARAASACTGTYMTTQMQQVPLPMVVSLPEAADNPALANRFTDGLRAGGGRIDGTSPLRMTMVFTLTTANRGQVYNNFSWADQSGAISINAGSLELTAQVMNTNSYAYVWAASVSCRIHSRDAGQLAYELGRLIGRTLGRDVQNGTF